MVTYKRGFTFQPKHSPETRPQDVKGRVANDLGPRVRSAMMPSPTTDTQEPRMSKRSPKGRR